MIPLQFDLFGIFSNLTAFLTLFIISGGIIGLLSRKLSIAAYGSLLVYVYVVMNTSIFIFDAILYLVLIAILLWGSSFVVSGYINAEPEGE